MQKRGKKAIEPLIATVLAIGFTIIIAVVVIVWGGNITKLQIGKTAEESEANLKCMNVYLDVKSSCIFGGKATMRIENTGREDIASFKYRSIGENIDATELKMSLPVYASLTTNFPIGENVGSLKEIEIFPQIKIKDKIYTCKQSIKKELADCFYLFNLKNAEDFTVTPVEGTVEVKVVAKNDIEKFLENEGQIFGDLAPFNTDGLALPSNTLIIYPTSDSYNANIDSSSFVITDNPDVTHIGIYAEVYNMAVKYFLVETDSGAEHLIMDLNPGDKKYSVEYRTKLSELKGKTTKLRINVQGAEVGYTSLFRFCYTDNSGVCVAK